MSNPNKQRFIDYYNNSLKKLNGVDLALVQVVQLAYDLSVASQDEIYFAVLEGVRSKEKQAENVKKGVSKTMNSRHIIGEAVDLGIIYVNKNNNIDFEWNDLELYKKLSKYVFKAADQLGVKLTWGGNWKNKPTDKYGWDSVHYQIEKS